MLPGCADALERWGPSVIRKVAPHVPVNAPAVQTSPPVTAALIRANIAAAQLLTGFLPARSAQVRSCSFAPALT